MLESFVSANQYLDELNQIRGTNKNLRSSVQDAQNALQSSIDNVSASIDEVDRQQEIANCATPQYKKVLLSSAYHNGDDLIAPTTEVPGVWNADTSNCTNPEHECSTYSLGCASGSQQRTVSGSLQGDNCVFNDCTEYCQSYDTACTVLNGNQFVARTDIKTGCVDPSHNTPYQCVDPIATNCPDNTFYYYADDNSTILEGQSTKTVISNTCTYSPSITDRPTFSSRANAEQNCSGVPVTNTCFTET